MSKPQRFLLGLIALILALFFGVQLDLVPLAPSPGAPVAGLPDLGRATPSGEVPAGVQEAVLVRVVDGDTSTVLLDGREETVRYIGIDTPERGEPGHLAATQAHQALLAVRGEGALFLLPDRSQRDPYGRLLRYVYTAGGVFVNREMIGQGWALPVEFPPDLKHASDFRRVAREAAEARRGFWSGDAEPDGAPPWGLTLEAAPLRAEPNGDAAQVAYLDPGVPLLIYRRDEEGRWVEVRTPERLEGWILLEHLFVNMPRKAIPSEVRARMLRDGP